MSSLNHMFKVLDLFSESKPVWTIDEATEQLSQSRSTVYRYFRALTDAGMLAPVSRGGYGLGPYVIKLDRQIRLSDPLLRVAPPTMARMHEQTQFMVQLGRLFQNDLLCIHQEGGPGGMNVTFARGRPSSMFFGATPKVILANLPLSQLKDIYLRRSKEIAAAGLGDTWQEFRAYFRKIRREGFYVSAAGEVDEGVVGIGVPIFNQDGSVVAGLTLVAPKARCKGTKVQPLVDTVVAAGNEINEALRNQ